MGKYPVTQSEWDDAVMGKNPSYFKKGGNHPVENVSWNEVQEFIKMLNSRDEYRYRLPTEAEWEYACRAGSQAEYYHGDDASGLSLYAVYNKKWKEGHSPVGSKEPNEWGLYDMLGNVWEWVWDWYDESYYKRSPAKDPGKVHS